MRGFVVPLLAALLAAGCLAKPLARPDDAPADAVPPAEGDSLDSPSVALVIEAPRPAAPLVPRGSGAEGGDGGTTLPPAGDAPAHLGPGDADAPAPAPGPDAQAPPAPGAASAPAPPPSGGDGSAGAAASTAQAAQPPAPVVAWEGDHDYSESFASSSPTYAFRMDDARLTRVRLAVVFEPHGGAVLVQRSVAVTLVEPNGADSIGCSLALPMTGTESCAKETNAAPGVWGIRFDGLGNLDARVAVTFAPDASD